jgi:uncharacterized protein (TIGR02246 family)
MRYKPDGAKPSFAKRCCSQRRLRFWIMAAFAAVSFATPVSAQGVDQNTKQQIEKIYAAFHDNWNKQDAAGLAGLYTKDGMFVGNTGVDIGTEAIIAHYQNNFKTGVTHHDSATIDQLLPLGSNAVMTAGEYHLSGQGQNGPIKADGHYSAVQVLENGAWKIRLLTAVPNAPPTSAATR